MKAAITSDSGPTVEHFDPRTGYCTSVPRAAWRIVPLIGKNPHIILFAESISGKILLLALFGILLDLTTGFPSHVLNFHHHFLLDCNYATSHNVCVCRKIPMVGSTICNLDHSLPKWIFFDTRLTAAVAAQEGVKSQNDFRVLHLLMPLAVFLLSAGVICRRGPMSFRSHNSRDSSWPYGRRCYGWHKTRSLMLLIISQLIHLSPIAGYPAAVCGGTEVSGSRTGFC
ncbi:MAG: hypothetical protein WA728_23470 [Xanthobacteraceae bacterium]